MQKTRILYLSNHLTLSKFEIPMLQDMGYEIYMPKKPDFDISCRVDWDLDKTLTIPQADLDILNEVDFYYDPLTSQQAEIINKYFDIAFCVSYKQMVHNMIWHFSGVVCFRAFGNGVTYTQLVSDLYGYTIWNRLEKMGSRFWFGAGYQSIADSEASFLKARTLFMPLGLPNAVVDDRWVGEGGKVLFPCPKIKTESYFSNVYEDFRIAFKGVPYVITGKQPISMTEDKHVLGYLSEEEYIRVFTTSSCMYYYSQLKTCIHYTPMEAICWGLPLLYLADGLLDSIGGESLPGRCQDVKEARKKALRLINGDKRLAERIRATQSVLLDVFTEEYCRKHWDKAMQAIQSSIPPKKMEIIEISASTKKRIGIVLPEAYLGGVLDYSIRLAKALYLGAKANRDEIEIIFAHIESEDFNEAEHFRELKEIGISIRSFVWEKIPWDQITIYEQIKGISLENMLKEDRYVPNDGNGFHDCDFLIFTADKTPRAVNVFIHIPYAIVLHDYIQRIIPSVTASIADNRNRQFVHCSTFNITTTPITKRYAVQYGLLPQNSIYIIPILVEAIPDCVETVQFIYKQKEFFLWSTNASKHKNHRMALRALSEYYTNGGRLKCCMTGVNTDAFGNDFKGQRNEYQREIRAIIQDDPLLKKNMIILGNLPKVYYYNVLKQAKFVLHPGYADNGNFSCFDAAFLGIPALSSRYPAMEYFDSYFGLGMSFFNPFDETDLCASLIEAEITADVLKSKLPSREALNRFVVSNPDIYNKIYQTIMFNCGINVEGF